MKVEREMINDQCISNVHQTSEQSTPDRDSRGSVTLRYH